jgi:hypothetical protein
MGWDDYQKKYAARADANLHQATNGGTVPVVVRRYAFGQAGDQLFQIESEILLSHGYEAFLQSEQGGHIHAGRLLLTGGLSVFAGSRGTRSGSTLTVSFRKADADMTPPPSPALDIPDQIRKLGDLHRDGILTSEEFEAKKAELLGRL